MKLSPPRAAGDTSYLIEAKIASLNDWRGTLLALVRQLVRAAAPDAVEALTWRGAPTWSDHGIICTAETYQQAVKITFPRGAKLDDPAGLFNASLEGKVRRAIDFRQDSRVDTRALRALVAAAVALNRHLAPPPVKNGVV